MPRCSRVRDDLTAWIDGALAPAATVRVEHHLARCPQCTQETQRLRQSIAAQQRLLPLLFEAKPVEAERLLAAVHRSIASGAAIAEDKQSWWRSFDWRQILRPLPIAVGAAVVVLITLVEVAGGPEDVLVPLGVKAPPAVVKKKPGMFRDYAIIERLDALENFDTVEVEPLDDEPAAEHG